MRLSTRFLVVLAFSSVILIFSSFISSRVLLIRAAVKADEEVGEELLVRAQSVLDEEANTFKRTVVDWASWDDTYEFMENRDSRYVDVNFVQGTLETLRIHAIALYDADHRAAASVAIGSNDQVIVSLPDTLQNLIERPGGLLDHARGELLYGYASENTDFWLTAAAPILTSNDEGPSRGTLVMARRIDNTVLKRWSHVIHPSFRLTSGEDKLTAGTKNKKRDGLRTLRSHVGMTDIFGDGRLSIEMAVPRVAFTQVKLGILHLTFWIVTVGCALWIVSVWLLNRWVLRSVTDSVKMLRHGLAQAGSSGRRREPFTKTSDDEIGELLDVVEMTIGTIEASAIESQRRRVEAVHAQRLAALGTMAAGVAHEVNNPNGVIHINLNVLRRELERLFVRLRERDADGSPETRAGDCSQIERDMKETLKEALAASDRIAGVVASLRSFTQPAVNGNADSFALPDLLDEASRWIRHDFKRAQCRLEMSLAPELPPLRGRRPQLLQVMINLLLNACQSATEPGMIVRVSADYDRGKGTLRIHFSDEGEGMAPEDIEYALDPFFTTRRESGGTGLGLSISAVIVKNHGGSIDIESDRGTGTKVTVILPVNEENAHVQ